MNGITEDGLLTLLAQWDDVSAAIDRILVCQPSGMSSAAASLEEQRKGMRAVINHVTRHATSKTEAPK